RPPILFSAFRPPKTNARNPPLVMHGFSRTIAQYQENGQVVFSLSDKEEEIEIADNWQAGMRASASGEPFHHTGYIGQGHTKTAVYARFKGEDYVLTQLTHKEGEYPHTEDENEHNLKIEYERLCQGDGIKARFDKHAKEYRANIPGVFVRKESQSWILPYRYFIATRLLPCGKVDGELRKFTGNDDIGPLDDDLTRAIHAFAHFMLIYTSGYLLLADLQGLYDTKRVMCLIDPQGHTYVNSLSNKQKDIYWDGGKTAIDRFFDQHLPDCKDNWFVMPYNSQT
ncbi:kinase-like domain-containing protein, partial [Hygrophoropsis aurantiaca]